jgi:hypothetical protein
MLVCGAEIRCSKSFRSRPPLDQGFPDPKIMGSHSCIACVVVGIYLMRQGARMTLILKRDWRRSSAHLREGGENE